MTASMGAIMRCARRLISIAMLWLLMAVSAFAHAALSRTEPADGARLASPPSVFRLTFSEPVAPTRLTLKGPSGPAVVLRDTRLDDTMLEIMVPAGLGEGGYVLSWRVVSQDGHPIGGSLLFTIGAGPAAKGVVAETDRRVQAGLWIGKLGLYLGLFFGIGGVFARCWLAGNRPIAASILRSTLLAGLAGAAVSAGFQGLDALGAPLSDLLTGDAWKAGLATSFGASVIVCVAAFACAGLAMVQGPGAGGRWISLAAVLTAGLALSLSGHASAADPQWLMRPSVFLHVTTVAIWAGALPLLAALLRQGDAAAPAALARFSRLIPLLILLLAAAGVVLAIVQLRAPEALVTTAYGRVFLVKLALLVPLFLLAAWNRWRLTARVLDGAQSARRSMVQVIVIESVMIALIFSTAALWRFTPPPRSLIVEPAALTSRLQLTNGTIVADLTFGGAGGIALHLAAADGAPLDPLEVALVFSQPEAGIEPIKRPATRRAAGKWQVEGVDLPTGGRWSVRLDIVVSDFEIVRLDGQVMLDRPLSADR
ncbi:copper resistance protein CopC [Rhizobium sp. YIM 134829]|uniref:copper resistance CopC/CopD family protein n=1 Tax=Rhizobium sp. YIM 134829 TaxID=3390453 RepID=UPI00397DAF7B